MRRPEEKEAPLLLLRGLGDWQEGPAYRFRRAETEPSLSASRAGEKTIDLVDPKSASVSAQTRGLGKFKRYNRKQKPAAAKSVQ